MSWSPEEHRALTFGRLKEFLIQNAPDEEEELKVTKDSSLCLRKDFFTSENFNYISNGTSRGIIVHQYTVPEQSEDLPGTEYDDNQIIIEPDINYINQYQVKLILGIGVNGKNKKTTTTYNVSPGETWTFPSFTPGNNSHPSYLYRLDKIVYTRCGQSNKTINANNNQFPNLPESLTINCNTTITVTAKRQYTVTVTTGEHTSYDGQQYSNPTIVATIDSESSYTGTFASEQGYNLIVTKDSGWDDYYSESGGIVSISSMKSNYNLQSSTEAIVVPTFNIKILTDSHSNYNGNKYTVETIIDTVTSGGNWSCLKSLITFDSGYELDSISIIPEPDSYSTSGNTIAINNITQDYTISITSKEEEQPGEPGTPSKIRMIQQECFDIDATPVLGTDFNILDGANNILDAQLTLAQNLSNQGDYKIEFVEGPADEDDPTLHPNAHWEIQIYWDGTVITLGQSSELCVKPYFGWSRWFNSSRVDANRNPIAGGTAVLQPSQLMKSNNATLEIEATNGPGDPPYYLQEVTIYTGETVSTSPSLRTYPKQIPSDRDGIRVLMGGPSFSKYTQRPGSVSSDYYTDYYNNVITLNDGTGIAIYQNSPKECTINFSNIQSQLNVCGFIGISHWKHMCQVVGIAAILHGDTQSVPLSPQAIEQFNNDIERHDSTSNKYDEEEPRRDPIRVTTNIEEIGTSTIHTFNATDGNLGTLASEYLIAEGQSNYLELYDQFIRNLKWISYKTLIDNHKITAGDYDMSWRLVSTCNNSNWWECSTCAILITLNPHYEPTPTPVINYTSIYADVEIGEVQNSTDTPSTWTQSLGYIGKYQTNQSSSGITWSTYGVSSSIPCSYYELFEVSLIDRNNDQVIKTVNSSLYSIANNFSSELANLISYDSQTGTWSGIINRSGKLVLENAYFRVKYRCQSYCKYYDENTFNLHSGINLIQHNDGSSTTIEISNWNTTNPYANTFEIDEVIEIDGNEYKRTKVDAAVFGITVGTVQNNLCTITTNDSVTIACAGTSQILSKTFTVETK